jgi:transcription elongation factor GreA
MQEKIYVTADGLAKLKAELDDFLNNKRAEAVDRLKQARSLGDLSENSLYDQAKANQSFVEGRIKELEDIIERAEIIEEDTATDAVHLGSSVVVHIDGDEETFSIVGEPEADPANARISHTSPLGKALIGKKINEEVEVEAPVGTITYRIVEIS